MENRRKIVEEITEAMYLIKRKIASEMHYLSDEMQITHPQWIVLHHVRKSGMINIKDLANLLGITSSAATQIVDGLVKKELLLRKRNEEDRRILNIKLSGKAISKFNSIKSTSFNTLSALFDVLDDGELRDYRDLNNKIASRIPDKSSGQKEKV
jgi:DNA-binding MarR family transcriptional regulator